MAGTWAPSGGAPAFASEIFGTGSDATVLSPTTAVYTMAATPGGGSAFNVTYTLSGATWGAALTSGSLAFNDADASGSAASVTLTSGGTGTDSTAVFRVDVNTSITAGDTFTLTYDIDGASSLASTTNTVTLGVTLVDVLGNVDTVGAAGAVATSAQGTALSSAATAGNPAIDVTLNSTLFVGSLTSIQLGSIGLADGAAVEDDGATAWATNGGDAAVTALTVTVNGGFAASIGVDTDANAATADGVFIDLNNNGAYNAGEEADTLTSTTATFNLTGAEAATVEALGTAGTDIYMVVDGTTPIEVSNPTVDISVDWTNATYADSSSTGNALAAVVKNGSQDRVEFALTPGGAFSNFIRITNPSSTSGSVFLTVTDDAGNSSSIDLGDVAGQSTTLGAGASTSLIDINDIAAATTGLDTSNSGKLRIDINAEFGATGTTTGVYATSVTVSTDGTTFSTFN